MRIWSLFSLFRSCWAQRVSGNASSHVGNLLIPFHTVWGTVWLQAGSLLAPLLFPLAVPHGIMSWFRFGLGTFVVLAWWRQHSFDMHSIKHHTRCKSIFPYALMIPGIPHYTIHTTHLWIVPTLGMRTSGCTDQGPSTYMGSAESRSVSNYLFLYFWSTFKANRQYKILSSKLSWR